MITIKCKVCGLVVGKNNFKRHMSIHDITVSKKDRDFQIKNIFVCSVCCKRWKTTVTGYKVHEKFCYLNPNRSHRSLGEDGRRKVGEASKQRKAGGYKVGILGGKGKRGYYKGYYCMSSWELAWLVYQLDHNKEVKQCRVQFDYEFNGKKRKYTPDFIINDIFYEIKNWHRPDTDAKIEAVKKTGSQIVLIEGKDIEPYLDYVKTKYGNNFVENLYEK